MDSKSQRSQFYVQQKNWEILNDEEFTAKTVTELKIFLEKKT
jgi:hypothetical protein